MEMFFKVDGMLVDVEESKIFDSNGKVAVLDFVNMTVKPLTTQSKLLPIRFNDRKELLQWELNKWVPMKNRNSISMMNAIKALIERKIEKELLG